MTKRNKLWISVLALMVAGWIWSSTKAVAATPSEIQELAKSAEDGHAISQLAGQLENAVAGFRSSTGGADFEVAARALGELVTRARKLRGTASLYERLVGLALDLRKSVTWAREAREDQAGGSEAALEKLYRSLDWNHLGYAKVASQYWTAWSRLGWAEGLPDGEARDNMLHQAEGGFVRGTIEVRRPWLARDSLLGAGMARRQLGNLKGAKRAFRRLETILSAVGDSPLLSALRVELAGLALETGSLSEAQHLMSKLPPDAIQGERAQAMRLLEAKGWLEQAKKGGQGAGRGADLIRQVIKIGGPSSRSAVGLALQYRGQLEGQNLGLASDLIDGEEAFSTERFGAARDAFARLLARKSDMPGLDQSVILYKYAASLSETGDRKKSISVLSRLMRLKMSAEVSGPAVRLAYALAAHTVKDNDTKSNRKKLLTAGERLVKIAPDAPEAGAARIWLARAREEGGSISKAIILLERNSPGTAAYAASRLELVSLRADRLGRFDPASDAGNKRMKSEGRKLVGDLKEILRLENEGKLKKDSARSAVLAVISAKASAWAGETPQNVLNAVAAAAKLQDQVPGAPADLLRLRLAMLTRAGRFADVEKQYARRKDKAIMANWKIWYEALDRMDRQRKPRAPAKIVASIGDRLATIRGFPELDGAEVIQARALLRAGEAARAAAVARHVIDRGTPSGPAWYLYASALEKAGDFVKATNAWRSMLTGLDEGTSHWLDAQLGVARTANASGNLRRSCVAIDDAAAMVPNYGSKSRRKQFEALSPGCAQFTGPSYVETLKNLNKFLSRKRDDVGFKTPDYGELDHTLTSDFTLDSNTAKCRLKFYVSTQNRMVSRTHQMTTFTDEYTCTGNVDMTKAFLNQDTVFNTRTLQFRNIELNCKKTTTGIKFGEAVIPRTEESSLSSFHLIMDTQDTRERQGKAFRAFGHMKRLCLKIPLQPVALGGGGSKAPRG